MPNRTPRATVQAGVFGVLGQNISYSRSPEIFRTVFAQLHWPAVYALFDLPERRLLSFLSAAPAARIAGLSVTIPHKRGVMKFCDRIDPTARIVGAVNALEIRNGRIIGHNTDASGIREVLRPYRRQLRRSRAIIFGSGGAARAVASVMLQDFDLEVLTVISRSTLKANRMLTELGTQKACRTTTKVLRWKDRLLVDHIRNSNLIVNATPLGGPGNRSQRLIPESETLPCRAIAFDLIYDPGMTRFLKHARRSGCHVILNGWPLLVEQADAAFAIWTGRRFPRELKRQLLADKRYAVS